MEIDVEQVNACIDVELRRDDWTTCTEIAVTTITTGH